MELDAIVVTALLGVALPALLGFAPALAERVLPEHRRLGGGVELVAAIAVGVAYAAGYLGWFAWPTFPPESALELLPYIGLLGAGLGATDIAVRRTTDAPGWRRVPPLFALAMLPWALLGPVIESEWSFGESALWLVGLAIVLCGIWRVLDELADWLPPAGWAGTLTLWTGGVALILLTSHDTVLAAALVPLVAVLAGLTLAAWLTSDSGPAIDASAVPTVLVVAATLVSARHYGGLSTSALLLIASGPAVLLALSALRPVADLAAIPNVAVRVLGLLITLTAAAVLAAHPA